MTADLRLSVVMPACGEGASIRIVLDELLDNIDQPCEVLVVVDSHQDDTAEVTEAYAATEPRVSCLVSTYGPGPAHAIRFGMDAARAPVIVVMMADGSDDATQVTELARLVEGGAVVASASRYMRGGRQIGGARVKRMLSRAAGVSLQLLARPGTCDAMNSFKAYSAAFARCAGIESRRGFAIGIELTAKARRRRQPVTEIPTVWTQRRAGPSAVRLAAWLPAYLRWYLYCFGPPLTDRRRHGQVAGSPP